MSVFLDQQEIINVHVEKNKVEIKDKFVLSAELKLQNQKLEEKEWDTLS